ncbi:MAG: hypothetical protein A2Y10_08770 [Planctomycetes bacterium GWF2_41_51]|nr:MAG: hypothetical protein A2Y10_08770 [Planctomycetes bacterium GWF2_41_51]HBG28352.1 hypothetical protein [Phycisphaerales bacterium]
MKHTKSKEYNCLKDFQGMPKEITKLLKSESDRGCILILTAYLEEILGLIVRGACVSDDDAEMLLQLRCPGGDFNSKILLCSAFGLIHHEEAQALKCIQRIRNKAAHFDRKGQGFQVLFDSSETIDQVANFAKAMNIKLLSHDIGKVRSCFIALARLLATKLYLRLAEVRPRTAPKTVKEIANEVRNIMVNTPLEKCLKKTEIEAGKGNLQPMRKLLSEMEDAIKLALIEKQKSGQEYADDK